MNDAELVKFACEKCNATPYFKLKYFVGGAQLTPYATLKQWLMEVRAREESVRTLEYQLKKHALEIKLEKEKLEFAGSDIQKELIELEIEDKTKDHVRYERNVRDAYTEKDTLLRVIKEFLASEHALLPDGTNLMDVFGNKELEEKLEAEYWTVRMAKQAALDVMFYGRVNEGNMDSITMMDPAQQRQSFRNGSTTRLGNGPWFRRSKTGSCKAFRFRISRRRGSGSRPLGCRLFRRQ